MHPRNAEPGHHEYCHAVRESPVLAFSLRPDAYSERLQRSAELSLVFFHNSRIIRRIEQEKIVAISVNNDTILQNRIISCNCLVFKRS